MLKELIIENFLKGNQLKKIKFYTNKGEEYNIDYFDIYKYKKKLNSPYFIKNTIKYFEFSKKDLKKIIKHIIKGNNKLLNELSTITNNSLNNDFILLKNGNIINPDISNHSIDMFIKRFLIFYNLYKEHDKNFSKKLFKLYDKIISILKDDPLLKKDNNILSMKNIIKNIMQGSSIFNPQKVLYRKKDIMNTIKRINKYGKDYKIFNHPFLFIIDEKFEMVLTIELYSSNFPNLDYLNKIIKDFDFNNKTYLDFDESLKNVNILKEGIK